MLRNKLYPIATLLLLSACETASDRASAFVAVPLATWSPKDQKAAAALITERCGSPPLCPADAVLERATLDYEKLRALVRAAGQTGR